MKNPPSDSNDEPNPSIPDTSRTGSPLERAILDASKPSSASGPTPPPKKSGLGLLMVGLVLTGVGLFALNEGIGLLPSDRTYVDSEAILHGSLIGGLGLLLLGGGLTQMMRKRLLFLPLLVIGSLVGFAWTQRASIVSEAQETRDARSELFDDFVEVCEDGEGIDDATRFEQGGTDHPTLVYFGRGSTDDLEWSPEWNETPEDWAVEDGDDVELVACIQVETRPIHRCSYGTPDDESILTLIQYVQILELRAARTGEILHREEFPGSEPPPCPNTHDFASGHRLYGSLVNDDDIYERIEEFMEDGSAETGETDEPPEGTITKPGKPKE